ncbi:MAG: response regulator [Anaerolineales bacterium]|nr:response regulator [Anaerolineales bacterium]MCA9926849.1 response regulator [Anaerolineales bacterium]
MRENFALIVEDNPDTAEIFEAACATAGFQTEVISDGQAALDRLQNIVPNLILLDLHLPNVSGDKILDHIIENEKLADVRIIVASADGQLATYQSRKSKNKLMVLQKPVSFDQLTLLAKRIIRADIT